jgi:phosphoethanolamine N-methyltransferase
MHLQKMLPLNCGTFMQFEASLKRELESARQGRSNFISEFSEKDYEVIVGGWQDKLVRVAEGTQKWGLFTAVRPPV